MAQLRELPARVGACSGIAEPGRLQSLVSDALDGACTALRHTVPQFRGSVLDVYRKEDGAAVRTVLNFDHTVEAVHSDAAPRLLPYAPRPPLEGSGNCEHC